MDTRVGKVTHFFNHISVAVLELDGELNIGDRVCFLGRITDFEQPVGSMEIDHQPVFAVHAGQEVAIKVLMPARAGDVVYKVSPE